MGGLHFFISLKYASVSCSAEIEDTCCRGRGISRYLLEKTLRKVIMLDILVFFFLPRKRLICLSLMTCSRVCLFVFLIIREPSINEEKPLSKPKNFEIQGLVSQYIVEKPAFLSNLTKDFLGEKLR